MPLKGQGHLKVGVSYQETRAVTGNIMFGYTTAGCWKKGSGNTLWLKFNNRQSCEVVVWLPRQTGGFPPGTQVIPPSPPINPNIVAN